MIRVENVTKSYQRGTTTVRALRGLTCEIPPGSMSFIVGPSGSGKSSLLYLLGALDVPTSGEIHCLGYRLSQLTRSQRDRYRRDEIGFIFQNFNLLANLNAVENVLVPYLPQGISAQKLAAAQELLRRVGLGERLEHRPNQLSGGEQQRVAIARALLKRPKLVLADEPTGELDSQSGAEVYRYLRELRDEQGSTVVIVTHDRSHIAADDHVLTLRDGQLAE
ncbi:MAG: ABC transporter ATP-binding protein [Planctomycetes bacterium]|nr:ABC transporter ATP-binding protein [Planctomycetota bacterium]